MKCYIAPSRQPEGHVRTYRRAVRYGCRQCHRVDCDQFPYALGLPGERKEHLPVISSHHPAVMDYVLSIAGRLTSLQDNLRAPPEGT